MSIIKEVKVTSYKYFADFRIVVEGLSTIDSIRFNGKEVELDKELDIKLNDGNYCLDIRNLDLSPYMNRIPFIEVLTMNVEGELVPLNYGIEPLQNKIFTPTFLDLEQAHRIKKEILEWHNKWNKNLTEEEIERLARPEAAGLFSDYIKRSNSKLNLQETDHKTKEDCMKYGFDFMLDLNKDEVKKHFDFLESLKAKCQTQKLNTDKLDKMCEMAFLKMLIDDLIKEEKIKGQRNE